MNLFYQSKKIFSVLAFCGLFCTLSASEMLEKGRKLCSLKKYAEAYTAFEKAAVKGDSRAWQYLGSLYAQGCGIPQKDLERAKLCFLAAERIKKEPQNAWNIGKICFEQGDTADARKWLKAAAGQNHQAAAEFLKEIDSGKRRPPQKKAPQKNNISMVYQSGLAYIQKFFSGTLPKSEKQYEKSPLTMLRLPHPPRIRMEGWNFSSEEMEKSIAKELAFDREGCLRLKDDTFDKMPIEDNLFALNPTIRYINAQGKTALFAAMKKTTFKQCSKAETAKIVKALRTESLPEEYFKNTEDTIWLLRKNLYFHYHGDFNGRWQVRSYSFIHKEGNKFRYLSSFSSPPDITDAAMTEGILRRDPACLINFAVRLEERELEDVFPLNTAEVILTALAAAGHPIANYNLGVYFFNLGKKAQAERCFKEAQKAGIEKYIKNIR